ncbi:MAG TPA: hypothetical protein PKM20_10030 [Nitrosomonas sp.]|nr:hypothetical protein [Nitrosomonas sp.]HNP27067.1 hypothetical protein [Nitrosomonas sp.]
MKKKYIIRLTEAECQQLEDQVYNGKTAAYRRTHAQILLCADEGSFGSGLLDSEVAENCWSQRTHPNAPYPGYVSAAWKKSWTRRLSASPG